MHLNGTFLGITNKHVLLRDKKINNVQTTCTNRVSYIGARVLLNLLNKLRKSDKMRGLQIILSPFRNELNKFNNIRTWMLDYIYHL